MTPDLTIQDRLYDRLTRLTLAAKDVAVRWDRAGHNGGTVQDQLLAKAMEQLAATLEEIGA
jgi:hypothetical protein